MTEPSPDAAAPSPGPAPKDPGKAKSPAKPSAADLLDVVEYSHHDPILGRHSRAIGVVVAIDDQGVTVVPLTHHHVRVDPADVTVVTADDADG